MQQVKDPELSLPWLGFHPWPGNFLMLCAVGTAKKKKKKKIAVDQLKNKPNV